MFIDIKPDPKSKRDDGKKDRRKHLKPLNDKSPRLCQPTSLSLETNCRLAVLHYRILQGGLVLQRIKAKRPGIIMI